MWYNPGSGVRGRIVNRAVLVVIVLTALLFGIVPIGAAGDPDPGRLHPSLRAIVFQPAGARALSTGAMGLPLFDGERFQIDLSTGAERFGVLVKTARPVSGVRFLGIPIRANTGTILSLLVSVSDLMALASSFDVVYVEPAWRTRPMLDVSVQAIHADAVHRASPPVTGEGVIVGIVDTGIDYLHLDFRYDRNGDGNEESSRILAIWDQTWGLLGAKYTRQQIESDIALGYGPEKGSVRQGDTDGHGTHVTGIAAGDGSSSSSGFVGVAPGAEIIAVKTSFYTSDILSGVDYIFRQADALGRPAVVNLSLGGHDGPHDGTSLFEQGLSELTGRPGRAIVVSAGNEGDLSIHVSSTLRGGTYSFDVSPEGVEFEMSLWYPGDALFTITVTPPAGTPVVTATGGISGYVTTPSGLVYVDNASAGVNPNNGDHEALIRLTSIVSGERWQIGVTDAAGGGRFDGWVISSSGTIVGGDSSSTIDEPGNARGVITVGAYNTKSAWPSKAGQQDYGARYPAGVLSSFSSQGPTRDGRTKPEICAPGAWIYSVLSRNSPSASVFEHPDGAHTISLGTSMASPHVAGTIALLFSIDARLRVSDLIDILTETAIRDAMTGSIPNSRWGWGKLDAATAVERLMMPEPPNGSTETPPISAQVDPNPASTSALFAFEVPDGARSVELRVYNIAGGLVFRVELEPTSGTYRWDLRSSRGEALAAGLYLYVVVTDRGASSPGKLVIR